MSRFFTLDVIYDLCGISLVAVLTDSLFLFF